MIEQYELRRNETQITIRDPFTLCLTHKCEHFCFWADDTLISGG